MTRRPRGLLERKLEPVSSREDSFFLQNKSMPGTVLLSLLIRSQLNLTVIFE
jgi:hypothetical protein